MKLNKTLKQFIGLLIAFPLSFIIGNEILANNITEKFEYETSSNSLLACGGGGGGGTSPADKAAKKARQAKSKLMFKKKQLSKMAASGEDTTKLEAQIAELEALIAK
tara:strand:- start:95 stop:415 length:321 start_codon:yes stop_codon:yes gene_type:complete